MNETTWSRSLSSLSRSCFAWYVYYGVRRGQHSLCFTGVVEGKELALDCGKHAGNGVCSFCHQSPSVRELYVHLCPFLVPFLDQWPTRLAQSCSLKILRVLYIFTNLQETDLAYTWWSDQVPEIIQLDCVFLLKIRAAICGRFFSRPGKTQGGIVNAASIEPRKIHQPMIGHLFLAGNCLSLFEYTGVGREHESMAEDKAENFVGWGHSHRLCGISWNSCWSSKLFDLGQMQHVSI